MSEQIDWSKAPEDATHRGAINWFKSDGEKVYTFDGAVWHPVSWEIWQLAPFAKRPSIHADEWSGEGIPPVGVVCEMHHEAWQPNNWPKVTVRYASAEYFITTDDAGEQHWHAHSVKFRPIRTPEKIAADERERFAQELVAAMGKGGGPNALYQARRMYDLGYRKP